MSRSLPPWAESIRSAYLRSEDTVSVVHGNVYDLVLHEGKLLTLSDFHVLAPALCPGDVVIMDNLSSHKRASVQEMIEGAKNS